MVAEFDLEFLTATLSEKGIALMRPGDRDCMAPAVARQVFDVSGAGDTVIAVLALCLASGLEAGDGGATGQCCRGHRGGQGGHGAGGEARAAGGAGARDRAACGGQSRHRDRIGAAVALWKANGERVVFTNGCFDLLHVGHITVLEQARRFGDRLIVAINSDASVAV